MMYRIPLFQNAQWDLFMTASLPIITNERLFSINNATWESFTDHGCRSLFSLSIENTCNYSAATVPQGVLAWICLNHTNTFSSDNASTVLKKSKTRFRLNNHILVFHNWQVLSLNILWSKFFLIYNFTLLNLTYKAKCISNFFGCFD